MAAPAPENVITYTMTPHVKFDGENWAVFKSAFSDYARQHGFHGELAGTSDDARRLAQATTALCSGWIAPKVLSLFKLSATDTAPVIWARLEAYYGRESDVRKMSLRDRAERRKQGANEPLFDFLSDHTRKGLRSRRIWF
jgi:hypothetical protein